MDFVLTSIKAVSEEIRIRIVLTLKNREACVCELMEVFGMAQSKLSHHLITLRNAGLLQGEKRGKWHYYRVNTSVLNKGNASIIKLLSQSLLHNKIIEKDLRLLNSLHKRKAVYRRGNTGIKNKKIVQKGVCCNVKE